MTDTVDAFIPINDGLAFPIAQVCISIRPNEDCAFKWGIAADVMYEDPFTGKWHAFPDERARSILDDIRRNDVDKWADIESAARQNSRPDCDEDDSDGGPVELKPHYFEDHHPTTSTPR